jgi:hypothetical protein
MLEHDNLSEALDHLVEPGLQLFVCEIDGRAAVPTGDLAFTYKISNELKVHLFAMRTGKLNTEAVRV